MTTTTAPMNDFPQATDVVERRHGAHYSAVRLGPVCELTRYRVRHPLMDREVPGKVFLHDPLQLTGMEISYGLLPPGASIPFYHKHRENEEVYLFLSGSGEFQVDGEVIPIEEGSAVRIAPQGVRCCRNTSQQPMFYICIQAQQNSLEHWTLSDGVPVPGPVTWPQER